MNTDARIARWLVGAAALVAVFAGGVRLGAAARRARREALQRELAAARNENDRMRQSLKAVEQHLRPSERARLEADDRWRPSVRPLPAFGHYLTHPCPRCGETRGGTVRHCADGVTVGAAGGPYPCRYAVNADAIPMPPHHVHRLCDGEDGACRYSKDEAAERCDHARTEPSTTYPDARLCLLCGVTIGAA